MITKNEKISLKQLEKLLILKMFSTPIFIIFTQLAQGTNNDGWIAILISTVFIIVCSFFISKICTIFYGKTIVEMMEKVFNRKISVIIGMLLFIKIVIWSALSLRIFRFNC